MTALTVLLDHLYAGDVVDTADLARASGTNPRSVSRWRSQETTPRREAEERLLELRAVVDLARTVMSDGAARFWMRSPNRDLNYEKPLDVVAEGEYQRVIDLLLALAGGRHYLRCLLLTRERWLVPQLSRLALSEKDRPTAWRCSCELQIVHTDQS